MENKNKQYMNDVKSKLSMELCSLNIYLYNNNILFFFAYYMLC